MTLLKEGVLLPLFYETCKNGFEEGKDPTAIVDTFFQKNKARRDDKSRINLLFRFIQYIERQVVLLMLLRTLPFQ